MLTHQNLLVKEGDLGPGWHTVGTGFQVKEGAPDADWVTITTDPVRSCQIGADINRPVKSFYW